MATYSRRLNTRNPFYLTRTAGTYILTGTCKVWIWDGHITSDKPASPNYTITKDALTTTSTEIIFEISQLVRDEFNHNRDAYNDAVTTFSDTLWVEVELTSTDTGIVPPTQSTIFLGVDGYGYFSDGANYEGTDFFTSVINNPIDKVIKMGIFAGHSGDGIDTVNYYNGSELVETDDLSTPYASSYSYDKNQYLTLIQNAEDRFQARVIADGGSYQENTCFNTFAESEDSTIDTIDLIRGGIVQETILVNNISECRYTYNTIKFYDRNGYLQQVYMYKVSKEEISVRKDSYSSIMGAAYSVEKHQIRDYNTIAIESISLNSGFVGEEQNDVFRQILLSEFVWVDDKPVTVKTNSFRYKKHVNNRLINYSLDFEYSNNVINNVY